MEQNGLKIRRGRDGILFVIEAKNCTHTYLRGDSASIARPSPRDDDVFPYRISCRSDDGLDSMMLGCPRSYRSFLIQARRLDKLTDRHTGSLQSHTIGMHLFHQIPEEEPAGLVIPSLPLDGLIRRGRSLNSHVPDKGWSYPRGGTDRSCSMQFNISRDVRASTFFTLVMK